MADTIYALFHDPSSAERAVSRLLAAGVGSDSIAVRSSEPFLEWKLPLGGEKQKTRLPVYAVAGGVVGGLVGFSLAAFSFRTMNLTTGDMPLIAPGPTGIVTFELTALGAIFATLLSLIAEAGLGRRERVSDSDQIALAQAVAEGALLVCARCPDETTARATAQALEDAGATMVTIT
jgi:hypothetical protein